MHKNTSLEPEKHPVKQGFNRVKIKVRKDSKDRKTVPETSLDIPFEDTQFQPEHKDSDIEQSHLTMEIEAGYDLQKTEHICPEQLHSYLDQSDILDDIKPRVIQEPFTPHVQDIIGVSVYQNATNKVLTSFYTFGLILCAQLTHLQLNMSDIIY